MTDVRCELPPPQHVSRWTLLAAGVAVLMLVDYAVLAVHFFEPAAGINPVEQLMAHVSWSAAPGPWSNLNSAGGWLVAATGCVCGPGCLLVAKIAEVDRECHPSLRGEALTVFAVAAGWAGTAGTLLFLETVVLLRILG